MSSDSFYNFSNILDLKELFFELLMKIKRLRLKVLKLFRGYHTKCVKTVISVLFKLQRATPLTSYFPRIPKNYSIKVFLVATDFHTKKL